MDDTAAHIALRSFQADRDEVVRVMLLAKVRRNEADLMDAYQEFLRDSFATEAKLRAAVAEAQALERQRRSERFLSRYLS